MKREPRGARAKADGTLQGRAGLAHAYQRTFSANATTEDTDAVLVDLVTRARYFDPPTYEGWLEKYGKPDGFEMACALHSARCEVVRLVLTPLNLDFEEMVALEKAAREEAAAIK